MWTKVGVMNYKASSVDSMGHRWNVPYHWLMFLSWSSGAAPPQASGFLSFWNSHKSLGQQGDLGQTPIGRPLLHQEEQAGLLVIKQYLLAHPQKHQGLSSVLGHEDNRDLLPDLKRLSSVSTPAGSTTLPVLCDGVWYKWESKNQGRLHGGSDNEARG